MVLYFIFVGIIIYYILQYLLTKNHDYWEKRNVPHLKPLPLFGNYKETILFKKHAAQVTQNICNQFPEVPYIGTFYGTAPALIVKDLNLIKLVLVTDFYYFSGREASDYSLREAMTKNIFFSGGDRWKVQRHNLTQLFTSAKIKGMFHLILNCANQLECFLENETKSSPYVETRALLAKYTIDCITTCIFGLNSDTMKKDAVMNPFMILREKIFESSKVRGMKVNCRQMWPALFYSLKFSLFDESIITFFHNILSGVFESRQKTKSTRNDVVDLILSWKEKKMITAESLSNAKTGGKKEISLEVSDELLMAQCVALFGAGFETTATTLSFVLYEIAKKPDVQLKVLQEVDDYLQKYNDTIEYDCVNELPYISACIDETLRLYPVLGVVTREVMEDYTLPTGLRLPKGLRIHIPVKQIHLDPNYFPEPEEYRPERFFEDERKNIKPFSFMPFGEGPRICLGLRFAKMPMHAGLLKIFRNYRVELPENMPHSIQLKAISLVTCSANDIHLKFISRKA